MVAPQPVGDARLVNNQSVTTQPTTTQSDDTTTHSSPDRGTTEVSARLLTSSTYASRNAMVEIDWQEPMDPSKHGWSPEWSPLFGTDYWRELTEEQRVRVTRHEFASVMSISIWFEMMLQDMVLRDQYRADYHSPEYQFALTEVADECRHSLMFALASQKMVGTTYKPNKHLARWARLMPLVTRNEAAYASILVAEEIIDVFQRGCMSDDRVLPFIRTVNEIHVLEESRHMHFAREQVRVSLANAGRIRRHVNALVIAVISCFVFISLIRPKAYRDAGLDTRRAVKAGQKNPHFQSMVRGGCGNLMKFLDSVGLLTRPAARLYRQVNLL